MARDFKTMTRIELESELSAERAAARRSQAVIVMMAVLDLVWHFGAGRRLKLMTPIQRTPSCSEQLQRSIPWDAFSTSPS